MSRNVNTVEITIVNSITIYLYISVAPLLITLFHLCLANFQTKHFKNIKQRKRTLLVNNANDKELF